MSEQEQTKLAIRLKPKDTELPEFQAMIKEFQAEDVKLDGVISVPKDNTFITDDKWLLILLPDRKDFAIAVPEDEYVILAER